MDLYQFTAAANSVLTAATFQPTGGVAMDTFLRLFDSDGNPLAAENNSPLYSRLHYVFATAGTYYVGVSGTPTTTTTPNDGGSGTAGSTGDYRLDLTVTPLSVGRVRTQYAAGGQRRRHAGLCRLGNCQREVLSEGRASISLWATSMGTASTTSCSRPPVTPVNATAPPQAYLIFGKPGGFHTGLDLNSLDADNRLRDQRRQGG